MNKLILQGEITADGRLKVELPPDLPPGKVQIEITMQPRGGTLGDVLASGLVGAWAHRTDIEDSAAYSRKLRRRISRRGKA
ncbi:MAG: hypothetical protein HXY40_12975 [Chloroflexi bacterium]|nr:hypothetical protein [Chloroflexota bacterium]